MIDDPLHPVFFTKVKWSKSYIRALRGGIIIELYLFSQ